MSTATAVRERGIPFSGPMVRALPDGRKTQTRRIVNPQPRPDIDSLHGGELRSRAPYDILDDDSGRIVGFGFQDEGDVYYKCPYGRPGDRLWVREHWRAPKELDPCNAKQIAERCLEASYPSPWSPIEYQADGRRVNWDSVWGKDAGRFRQARFMPRWASRITLAVTEIRLQRLQDISEEDAIAEGVEVRMGDGSGPGPGYKWTGPGYWDGFSESDHGKTYHVADVEGLCVCHVGQAEYLTPARCAFRHLWDKINGVGSWVENQWVWAVSFKVCG